MPGSNYLSELGYTNSKGYFEKKRENAPDSEKSKRKSLSVKDICGKKQYTCVPGATEKVHALLSLFLFFYFLSLS